MVCPRLKKGTCNVTKKKCNKKYSVKMTGECSLNKTHSKRRANKKKKSKKKRKSN